MTNIFFADFNKHPLPNPNPNFRDLSQIKSAKNFTFQHVNSVRRTRCIRALEVPPNRIQIDTTFCDFASKKPSRLFHIPLSSLMYKYFIDQGLQLVFLCRHLESISSTRLVP